MTINLSLNELSSLLKRSFEGLGYSEGCYEDAASAVVWLESHGMDGLGTVASSWPERPSHGGVELVSNESGTQVMDANHGNVALCGRRVVDLAIATAAAGESGHIELRRCHGRIAILPSLCLSAARGLYAIAHWSDATRLSIATIDARQPLPDYSVLEESPAVEAALTTLVLVCSKERQVTETIAAALVDDNKRTVTHVRPTEMQASYDAAIRNGMRVDASFIRSLTKAADAVLVEATQQSRLGAGE